MAAKAVLLFCAQALMVQSIATQCIGWAAAPCGGIYETVLLAPGATAASRGGSLPIAATSIIAPNGLAVTSENSYAGDLNVRGALPFLGTVGLEGNLPTAGIASAAYNCGNGAVGILSEGFGAAYDTGRCGCGRAAAV